MTENRSTTPAADPPRASVWLAALIGGVAVLLTQIGVDGVTGNDGFYHVRMAERLPEWGFVQSFPWLQWTIFREQFVSHHHGFHALLAPFVWTSQQLFDSPMPGARLAMFLCLALTAALVHLLLTARRVPHAIWWVALLAVLPWHFWLRMAYCRAPMLGLPLLLLCTWACLRQRPVLLGIAAFAFVHVYGGFVLLPAIPAAFLAGAWFAGERLRPHWFSLLATCVGLTAGVIINPYFPHNIEFLRIQLFVTGLGGADDIGREWRSYDAYFLVVMSAALAMLWCLSLVRRLTGGRPADGHELALLLLNLGFLALTLKSRRFIEYWPVFALLNTADMGRWWFAWSGHGNESRDGQPSARGPIRSTEACVLLAGAIVLGGITHLFNVSRELRRPSHDHESIAPAMAWMRTSTPAGSIVFADDWDVFPVLFYYNQHNYFCTGLDPQFTAARWPAMWERYKRITRGEAPATVPRDLAREERRIAQDLEAQRSSPAAPATAPAEPTLSERRIEITDIRERFGANYVIVDDDHGPFYQDLLDHPRDFALVYPTALAASQPAEQAGHQPPIAVFAVLHGGPKAPSPSPATMPQTTNDADGQTPSAP